ncbi:MAG: 2-succinyl-6-hydroxy-2,4-cyclohexadiene-1-carboxylate synthase [candidate division Zixibacteria bacterium]|nr:2-succinyl-6-hydroxy-2,4-cyclohexadiene-1-carboxylate synthase [candidate division Zixibacteria bacterium]
MTSTYRLHYTQKGSPSLPPIVFLHGFTGCGHDWRGVVDGLSDSFHCLLPDLPGHGQTIVDGSDEEFHMDRVACGLVRWLDELSIEKCHLVAYSMGGRLGLYLAINYSDRFDRIVLESSSPGLKTEEERAVRRAHDALITKKLQTMPVEEFMREWYDQPLFDSLRQYPDKLEGLLKDRSRADMAGWAKSLAMMGTGQQASLWPRLNEVKASLRLIVGEKDAKFQEIAKEMAEEILGTTVAVVAGAGHNVHLEQPVAFVEQVRQYLT